MRRSVVALLVVAVALAGCVGSGGEAGDPAGNASQAGDAETEAEASGAASAGQPSRVTFAVEGSEAETVWANGSFAAQETCNAGGCPQGTDTQTTDLTDVVPAGVPTVVNLTLTWESDAVPDWNEASAWVSSDGTFYAYDWTNPEDGRVEVGVIVVRSEDGSVAANVFGGRPQAAADPSVEYTLRADVQAQTEVVPAGTPVAIELQPGQTVVAEATGDDAAAFRVYGPGDDALAYVESENGTATWRVPSNLSGGEYVLANTWASDVALTLDGTAPLRALTIDFQTSEPTTYEATGTAQWEIDVARAPIWAGIYVTNTWVEFVNAPAAMQGSFEATLTLPDGGTAGGSIDCGPCVHSLPFLGGSYMTFGAARADPGLVPGTYQAELTADAAVGYEYGHIVGHYVR